MKTIEDMNRLIGTLPVPLPKGPYMEATPPPVPQQESDFPPWLSGAHQFAMQQFLKAFAERQREPQVPSWQMPYPMQATAGERQVLGMMPIAGDVEDVRYLMEGVHEGDPAKAAMGGAAAMMPFMPASLLHTVYHGSPHIFDAFKMSKLGTGEGAQAYGHGLYFAESPGVAKSYQTQLTGRGAYSIDGQPVDETMVAHWQEPLEIAATKGDAGLRDYLSALDARIKELGDDAPLEMMDVADAAESMIGKKVERATGAFYEVEIPDEAVGRMLDWDTPLSEQPKSVQSAYSRMEEEFPGLRFEWNRPGAAAYRRLGNWANESMENFSTFQRVTGSQSTNWDEATSQYLARQGIPGIRYLDQLSRGAGEGTRNLVLFDESLATIMERQ